MKISAFQAIYPNLERIVQPDTFFATVKNEFTNYARIGFFQKDPEPGIFVHEIDTGHSVHTGLITCLDLEDYSEGRIMRHEHTIPGKEQHLMNLLLERKAMIKPVLLTYRKDKKISDTIQLAKAGSPFYTIDFDNGEKHRVFKITDHRVIKSLRKRFKKHVSRAYIADGHHRCVASAKLHATIGDKREPTDFSKLLCVLFPFEDVLIHDYNRVIEILHEVSPTLFMARMSRICKIKPLAAAAKPSQKYELTMYILGEWYAIKWKKAVLKKFASRKVIFDGEILNKYVLHDILGISDVRNDLRIKYVEGISGVEGIANKVEKSIFRVAFCLRPIEMQEIVKVAGDNETLPPKSTWFEPRIKNGFIVKSFEEETTW